MARTKNIFFCEIIVFIIDGKVVTTAWGHQTKNHTYRLFI